VRVAKPVQRIENILTLGLLLLAIGLPSADSLFELDPTQTPLLNRPLAKPPTFPQSLDDLRVFPAAFEPFFDDRFGFKDFLVRSKSAIAIFALGSSPSRNILLGRDGWLFLSGGIIGQPGRAIEDFTGQYPLTRQNLEEWRIYLEQRHDVLHGMGIEFVFAIAPNKATIYPEQLPRGLAARRGRSRLDQLIQWLARDSKLQVVDLRPALIAAKAEGRVYEKTGTHWNERGAFAADAALARWLSRRFPRVRPLPADNYEPVAYDAPGRELASMSGIADLMREEMWRMKPRGMKLAKRAEVTYTPRRFYFEPPFATERAPSTLPRAVIFHDSFYKAIQPFLSEHFSRAAYYWQYDADLEAVKAERPDVVIQLVGERVLLTRPGS